MRAGSAVIGNTGTVSVEGESYEQWLERTAPKRGATPSDSRRWDVAVAVLLAVFFLWVGGEQGWIGLGLVAALVAELVVHVVVRRRTEAPLAASASTYLRGATLLVTLVISGWLIMVAGAEAAPLPLLLVMLDLKDERSFLRWAFDRLRGRSAQPR